MLREKCSQSQNCTHKKARRFIIFHKDNCGNDYSLDKQSTSRAVDKCRVMEKETAQAKDDGSLLALEPVSLDHFGPIILNSDGTMSRIPNWAEMSAPEKETAKRLISKRNARRKDALTAALNSALPFQGDIVGSIALPPLTGDEQQEIKLLGDDGRK